MDHSRINALAQLEFKDPRPFLVKLHEVGVEVAESDVSPEVRNLRTNPLKKWRETREAALFCYGMGQLIGQTVFLAQSESQDYDFVASWVVDDVQHIAPVQLKEVVPPRLNAAASLQRTIESLSKYVDSEDLTVPIHLNQRWRFEPEKLVIPALQIAGLWVFGAISEDQSDWVLCGNFLEKAERTCFAYPT